ncbi:hypothetical protein J6590_058706 [Homalodisca vitripennis]|nr:hypothetical protein J6590_058706 [Homalodisca vitripennis]
MAYLVSDLQLLADILLADFGEQDLVDTIITGLNMATGFPPPTIFDKIISTRPYQYALPKLEHMREHIDYLLSKCFICPSTVPNVPTVPFLVPKKDGKSRLVVNYRGINSIFDLEATPMRAIESAFQHLGQCRCY